MPGMLKGLLSRRHVRGCGAVGAVLALAGSALAGGTPENILLVVNPASQESMYLANYYRFKRNVPERNIAYVDPGAANYQAFAGPNGNVDALFGILRDRNVDDHVDYVVVAGTDRFFVSAPGHVVDAACGGAGFPTTRFSQSSVYTTAFMGAELLAGGVPVTLQNHYYSNATNSPRAFDSNTRWVNGLPSAGPTSRRYFIGAQLGYTGERGTTLGEIFQMIDRSVAVDGTRPAGSFYYMNNLADSIRNARACGSGNGCSGSTTVFTNMVNAITGLGGTAEIINGILPAGRANCLGIMTGAESPPVDGETMTILPGAFCDHLTSWAATFDNGAQVKMSAWIRRGASGTSGTVEEPCLYLGKFPNPNLHVNYYQGLSLGEAHLRSLQFVPFQHLLLGDPMTRPFATFPTVTPNLPAGPLSGVTSFTPSASTTLLGASISRIEVLVDGELVAFGGDAAPLRLGTYGLADGWHEVRILAYDSTLVKNVGRWVGMVQVSNAGRGAQVAAAGTVDLTTPINATVTRTGGGTVQQVRLLQNGRIVASAPDVGQLTVYGRNLGAGRSKLTAEILYTDGRRALSQPVEVEVSYSGGPATATPVAFGYSRRVPRGGPFVLELPARFPDNPAGVTYEIVSPPSQATIGGGTGAYRVLTAPAAACGADSLTFRVTNASGVSNVATISLTYGVAGCMADADGDRQLTVADFTAFLQVYAAGDLRADADGSCALNVADFTAFLQAYAAGCP